MLLGMIVLIIGLACRGMADSPPAEALETAASDGARLLFLAGSGAAMPPNYADAQNPASKINDPGMSAAGEIEITQKNNHFQWTGATRLKDTTVLVVLYPVAGGGNNPWVSVEDSDWMECEWCFGFYGGSRYLFIGNRLDWSWNDVSAGSSAVGAYGEWRLYGFSYDGANVRFYMNGRFMTSVGRTIDFADIDVANPQLRVSYTFWNEAGYGTYRFVGVWDRVLGDSEIMDIYQQMLGNGML